jgi:hypothetical protein
MVNCYTIILSNREACDKRWFCLSKFVYISEKMVIFSAIDVICNLDR